MTTSALAPSFAPRRARIAIVGAFGILYLFWGMTFLAIRYAVLDGVPPVMVIAVRCVFGALILFAWLGARGELRRATRAEWVTAALAGSFLFIGGHTLMAWAEQHVDSGETALLMTTIPLWLVLITSMRQRRAPSARVVLGLAVGTAGVAMLTVTSGALTGDLGSRAVLLVSALAWAVGSVIARDGARRSSAGQSTAMQLAAGGAAVLALAAISGDLTRWNPMTTTARAAWSLAFLVICGTVLGFAAYTWLLRVATPAAVGSYAFVNPIVALAIAGVAGDTTITPITIVSAALVLGSVSLTRDTNRTDRRTTKA